jgi:hypothetical protein
MGTTIMTPPIVTNGLVLHLDSANQKSYISGSANWNDLSGNGNNANLINGPIYNSTNGGTIVFDGVNDGANIPTNATLQPPTSLTLESIFKINSYTNGYFIVAHSGNATGAYVKYGFRLLTSGGVMAYMNTNTTNGAIIQNISNINIVLNTWIHSTMTYDGASSKIYINGSLANTGAITGTINYTEYGSPYYLSIGRKSESEGGYVSGSVSVVKVYNKTLSATEVLQNYNALKSRFNLN